MLLREEVGKGGRRKKARLGTGGREERAQHHQLPLGHSQSPEHSMAFPGNSLEPIPALQAGIPKGLSYALEG